MASEFTTTARKAIGITSGWKSAGQAPAQAQAGDRLVTAVALRTTKIWGSRRYLDMRLLK